MDAEQLAVDFVSALLDIAERSGLLNAPDSYAQNAIYNAVAAHLGWFQPAGGVRQDVLSSLPSVPTGLTVACLTPTRDTRGAHREARDVSCGCAVRNAGVPLAGAVGSLREGLVVSVRPHGGPVCEPRARGAIPHPEMYTLDPGTPALPLEVGAAVVAVLLGRVRAARLVLTNWPVSGVPRPGRPGNMSSEVLLVMAGGCRLAVRNDYGEHSWPDVSPAYLARSPEAIDEILRAHPATRALPGEPCPRCGAPLTDPDVGKHWPIANPTGADADSWLISGVRLECARCGVCFDTPHQRRVSGAGRALGYERSR